MSLSRNNISHMMGVFEECVKLGYEYWKINELTPMDVNTALKLPLLQGLSDKSQIKCDAMWHTKLKVNGFETLKYEMKSAKDSYTSGIFLITASPDKTFAVLYDKDFNLALSDSHLHFTVPPEQMSFDDALKHLDCRGMIVLANKSQYLDFITYIFTVVLRELRASPVHGNIVRLEKKI